MKKLVIILTCLVFVVSSCKTKEKIQSQNPGVDLNEKFISLFRTACYGTCPSYKITIKKDGSFTYLGKSYVNKLGSYKGKLSQEETAKIFEKVDAYKWNQYPEKYPLDNVDFPQFILEYNTGKKIKQVQGNSNAAKELLEFNKSIDLLIENIEMEKV